MKNGIIKVIQIVAALVIVFGIVGGILLIPAMFMIYNEVLYLIATEWFTIENIINLLK